MDTELRNLLQEVPRSSESYNLLTLNPPAKYNLLPEHRQQFWERYCSLVSGDQPFARSLGFAEPVRETAPITASFTLRFHVESLEDTDWEPFDDNFIPYLTKLYQEIIRDYFHLPAENKEIALVACELISRAWFEAQEQTQTMVMQVRLHFPFARCSKDHARLLRIRAIQSLRTANATTMFTRQPIGDWEDILAPVADYLLLYGSTDGAEKSPCQLGKITKYAAEDEDDQDLEVGLESVFFSYNHRDVHEDSFSPEIFEDYEQSYWLPLFFSVLHWMKTLRPKNPVVRPISNEQQVEPLLANDNEEAALLSAFLEMVSPSRYLENIFWSKIGQSIYSACRGDPLGAEIWSKATIKALDGKTVPFVTDPKTCCVNLYRTFGKCSTTVKTLAWYARTDSPDKYRLWHRAWCAPTMEKSLSTLHTDVAQALYRFCWLEYLYCPLSGGRGRWFHYVDHRWVESIEALELRGFMSRAFVNVYENIRTDISFKISSTSDENLKKKGEANIESINKLIKCLKTGPFKNHIISEAKEQFKCNGFLSLLDSNPNLTGTCNGVLEAISGQVIFRPGYPEDFLSMRTNIIYDNQFTYQEPLVQECLKWLGQVFPDKLLLHHFLKFAASFLQAGNIDKIFPIWTGDGDNSKSMVVKLFEITLGVYCIKFPVTLVSEKGGNSSGPTPQLARAKGTRVAFLDEPEDDVPMCKGTIKKYTGGDSFFARLLHENGDEIKATFTMVLMCNKVPIIPNADRAIKNRARLFPFLSKWIFNAPATEEEQYATNTFPRNNEFDRRISVLAPAFLWIMVNYFGFYSQEGLTDPPIVTATTELYWKENDVYAQFTSDVVEVVFQKDGTPDPTCKVSLTNIYSEFKIWFRDAFPGTKVPERTIVKQELNGRWGKLIQCHWYGIRITNNDQEDLSSAIAGKSQRKALPTNLLTNGSPPKKSSSVRAPPSSLCL